jgi:ribonucleoside-diphosphate reductase alpha chain
VTNPFKSNYEQFIYTSRYARWVEEEKRRETWDETVKRYLSFISDHLLSKHDYTLDTRLYDRLFDAIYNLNVVP